MKNLFKYAFTLVVSALVLSACTDEYEYDAPAPYEGFYITGEQSAYMFTPADESQSFTVKVVRPQGGGEETIALTNNNELFNVPESVTFEAGQTEAEFTVTCALESGQSETLNISLPEGTYDETYFSGTFSIYVVCDYVWEDAGTVTFYSELLISGFGLNPIPDVKVRHAVGTNLYELIDVYKAGYNLQFTLDDDYNADELPEDQDTGLVYSGSTFHLYYYPEYGNTFTNDGNTFTMNVYILNATTNFGTWDETFVWEDWPGGE